MIEPRVYRTAFIPAIVLFVVAMFSLESEPPGAEIDLAADVLFEGPTVAESAAQIAREHPDRRPGTPGDAAVADLVAGELSERGFDVAEEEFTEDGLELRNVVGTRVGAERDRIVLVAGRDARSVPDLSGSAADTAALLELAAALEGRAPEKTVLLASVDGSTLGDAGARELAGTVAGGEPVEAVIVLSDVGAGAGGGPAVVTWSNDVSRASIGLQRTAEDALRREFDNVSGEPGVPTQLAQLAFPLGIGAQGVLLEQDIESIRFAGSGLLPPDGDPEEIDEERLGGIGRAVLQTISAIDSSEEIEHGPSSYLLFARNVLPGWAVWLLAGALVLPVLVASVDAFARARRRREPVAGWGAWVLARIVPFAVGLLVAMLFVVSGLAPGFGRAAPPPSLAPLDARAAALLAVTIATTGLAWIFLRPLLARWGGAERDPSAPGAGCAVALVVSATTLAVWVFNPFAALMLAPAAHLWTLAALTDAPVGIRARGVLVALGLVLPVAVATVHMVQLSLDPLEALWYLFLLVAGGQVGLLGALAGCVLLGGLGATVEILLARRRQEPAVTDEPSQPVRGPGGYAGPGSLGGTQSALRR